MSLLAPFADVERMVNTVVLGSLANSIALVNGARVPVIFERPHSGAFGGQVDAAAPECTGPADALGALQRDDPIRIDGVEYFVASPEPDGAGLVRLVLYTAGN